MPFKGMEDRLNPIPPEGVDDTTLGGYAAVHGRAPGFEGSDGSAYTVAIETEASDSGDGSWVAYLVFLRWADAGTAIMGHLETDDILSGGSANEVRQAAERIPLNVVKDILDRAIENQRRWEAEVSDGDPDAEAW